MYVVAIFLFPLTIQLPYRIRVQDIKNWQWECREVRAVIDEQTLSSFFLGPGLLTLGKIVFEPARFIAQSTYADHKDALRN